NINGNHSIGGLVGVSIYGSNITNSFTTSNVNGINSSSTGGLIGINDGDYFGFGPPTTITNSFYYNSTENPSRGIGFDDDGGIVTAESNLSYFYDNTNQPFNGNWDSNVWNFTGNNLPFFNGQENPFLGSSILNSQSISSLFPLGGLSISFLIILGFLLF
ncbi:MAG: hypothetical protein VX028_00055, partial [Nanoarchaeota archaeon]|nr:hypothetical protein [Nanoarchaeota archaeon]